MGLDNMFAQFKDMAELQAYAQALNETIINLAKKIDTLEAENKKLKASSSLQIVPQSVAIQESKQFDIDDEEAICRMQLRRLREISMDREMTLEESKRVEIYTKLLQNMKNQPKTIVVEAKRLSDKELLVLAEGSGDE